MPSTSSKSHKRPQARANLRDAIARAIPTSCTELSMGITVGPERWTASRDVLIDAITASVKRSHPEDAAVSRDQGAASRISTDYPYAEEQLAPTRYPLRCSPAPFEGEPAAGWTLDEDGATCCRQLKASDIGCPPVLDQAVYTLDEELHEGAVGEAWGAYGEPMVSLRPGAEKAFAAWLDEWTEVRAWVNEGAEP